MSITPTSSSPPSPAVSIEKAPTAKKGMFILEDGRNVAVTFALMVLLFALWGFCNGMIDVMDKHFQEELHLTLSQSAWVQFAHYLGYFLMALPAGWLAAKLGYKGGIITGLLIVAVGGFWFLAATHIAQFWAFLLGVCVIAGGLTFLETIANPYTTVLGPPEFGASRINLAQSCNSLGFLLGPIVGGLFFYSKNAQGQSTGSERVWIPYVAVAVIVLVLALVFWLSNMPDIKMEDTAHPDATKEFASGLATEAPLLWKRPHFVMGVAAQFFYIAAQAGIFSFFINYLTREVPPIPPAWDTALHHAPGFLQSWFGDGIEPLKGGAGKLGFTDRGAANLNSVALLAFLLGRSSGTALLRRFAAHTMLGIYSVASVLLCLVVMLKLGWLSVACVFLTYFFMSIMFPTIFALGIFGLGSDAKRASSFLVMAIMGGAIMPKLMGEVGDHYTLSHAFIVPLVCFIVVAAYGFLWPKLSGHKGMRGLSVSGGH